MDGLQSAVETASSNGAIFDETHENGDLNELDVEETCCSTNSNTNGDELKSLENALQRRYQVDVIRSHDFPSLPAAKSYPIAQKEIAAKLYELCNESHYLVLKLKYLQESHKNAIRCLERKWVAQVQDVIDSTSDDVTHELKYWSLQIKSYEEHMKNALKNHPELVNSLMSEGQLCFDSCYSFEAYHEKLEFATENRDYRFKIVLRYFDGEINVDCSLHMEGLNQLVEKCFSEKCSVDVLIRSIWSLAKSKLAEDN